MAFQVSRTDTSQFVLMDPSTDTVIIDDDLAVGFAKLEQTVANKPAKPTPVLAVAGAAAPATEGSAAFSFAGGPRYTPVLLAVVLPFAWLAVLYLALANLLSEHALDRSSARETQAKIDELEREVQALRSEISGAPRTAKSKPKLQPASKPKPLVGTAAGVEPDGEPPAEGAAAEPPADDGADDDGRVVEQPTEGIR
jgi:outer membrane murein-binding lipoprotein Lpp